MRGGGYVLCQPRPLGGISMPVKEHGPERECEPPAKQRRQPVDLIRLADRPALRAADGGHLADEP